MIFIGDLVEIENQSDGSWEGPFEVVDIRPRNDFFANGTVECVYLIAPGDKVLTPGQVDNFRQNLFAHQATRADALRAWNYPIGWARLAS